MNLKKCHGKIPENGKIDFETVRIWGLYETYITSQLNKSAKIDSSFHFLPPQALIFDVVV
jgi:hypothetical protein